MLEYITLSWNVVGTGVVIAAAITTGSVALAGFGLASLIEIGASTFVVWQRRLEDPESGSCGSPEQALDRAEG
jgi:divalent metal cation (Fe/Co/Zn/Cd) transporter